MSIQLQPSVSLVTPVKTEPSTVIKNEPPEEALEKEISPDIKDMYIVYHCLSEDLIKNETVPENILETKYLESVETQVSVKTEDTSDENVTRGIDQEMIEVQGPREHSNTVSNLETHEQLVLNSSKDLNGIVTRIRKAKHPKNTNFVKCYKTVETTSWEKDKEKIKVIKAPVIPVEAHEYTSLANDSHVCNHCQHTYKKLKNLKVHVRTQHREVTIMYQCPYCSYKSKWKQYNIKRHFIQKHKNTKDIQWFQCNLCEMKFKLKGDLTRHMKVHLRHKQLKDGLDLREKRCCCEKCMYTSKRSSDVKRHQLTHKTKAEMDDRLLKYRCNKCKYNTYSYNCFKLHKLSHLKPEEIHYFYCYHCSYKSKHKLNLQTHIFRHFKDEDVPFHCYICDFTTLKRNLIIEHFKKHRKHHSKCDETDYKNHLETYTMRYRYCKKCYFKTYHYERLKLHELTHKTEAKMDDRHFKYRCDKCKYKTFRHQSFKRHKLIHLKPEEIHFFYCYHCSYKCKEKAYLQIHIVRHFEKGEVPFHCYICDFATLKRNLIIEHLKKHPKHHSKCDETDYKNQLETYSTRYCCEKCTYTSGKSSNFKLHKLTHKTKAEIDDRLLKYRCDKCKFKSYRCNSLKKHKLTHLKPEEIQYFFCYRCSYKSKRKGDLKTHIFRHFKNEDVPFHCYICDFVTLKRESFKKHLEHHNKCDERIYKSTS